MMMKGVKVGDLVRVSTKVHQEGIPPNRMGIVLRNDGLNECDIWLIQLTNGVVMKFHNMHLEIMREA